MDERRRKAFAECTRFLRYHYPVSVREHLEEIAASPYAEMKADHYGVGGYVAQFEEELARLLGKEAAVLMPSGTMAQQIALRLWSDEAGTKRVAFHPTCHLLAHEHNAFQELHHLEGVLLGEPQRLFNLEDLEVASENLAALLIELPQREIGGQLPSWEELAEICSYASSRDIRLHMDGARLWECAPYYGRTYAEIAEPFDSVYVSLYKILNGLPGAVLAGPVDFIAKARIWQRRHGGNLHQMAPNAIAGKLGTEKHLPRMPDYVAKAQEIAAILKSQPGVEVIPENPPTNMMHVFFAGEKEELELRALQIAEQHKVLLFGALSPIPDSDHQKLELVVGEAALDLSNEELLALFNQLLT
jgi:threonine aldolase